MIIFERAIDPTEKKNCSVKIKKKMRKINRRGEQLLNSYPMLRLKNI